MADTKWSQFPSATPGDSDEVVGLHAGDNARFSVANFILAIRQGLANIFVPLTRTINGKALNNDISLNASDVGAVATSAVGAADGVASLDSNGKVPGTQLDLSGKQDTITANGILKGDGAGGVSAATPGTDYQEPLNAGTDYATPTQLEDKAAKADLTNIQATGTTNNTGAVIPAGACFYLNGVLHRAITQIDVNATFTPGTNCEQTTVGDRLVHSMSYSGTSGNFGECLNAVPVGKTLIAVNIERVNGVVTNNHAYGLYGSDRQTRSFYVFKMTDGSRVTNASITATLYFV